MSFEDAKRMSQGLPPLNDTYPDISDDQVNDILDHLPEEEDDDILNAYRDWKKNCAKVGCSARERPCPPRPLCCVTSQPSSHTCV